ncbi:hypothetical protein CYANOKiyG1_79340 [Okeania sp. KiyG1]|nr:hypothetical protein CYANOKiyG1_79340 [Okeania sp. KiyG1]
MAIVRFSPWREIDSLQKEMNRVFDNFAPYLNGEEKGIAFKPAAEMEENHEAIELKLELPGLEAKDVDVQVTAEAVAIKGERRQEVKTEEKKYDSF